MDRRDQRRDARDARAPTMFARHPAVPLPTATTDRDDDDDDDETDESGGVAPRDPAVFGFMAAVVDVVAGGADERVPRGRHVDAPKEYALRVACCRALETIADESSNGAEYSNATEYYSDSKYSDPSSSPSTAAPFANETDGGFDAFDVLMDAVDGAPEAERTYRDVVGETLRLWCHRPAPPPGSNAWMHDPNGASGNPRGGFFGAMAALLLGDDDEDDDDDRDDDDWNASVFSPLGDAAGAALTRLMHRPARYDGVAEAGRGVADESARAAVVSTSGTVVRRETDEVPGSNPASAGGAGKSREKWGGGLGEVETVMRRASMDVDDDPGSPLGSSSRRGVEAGVGSPFAPGIDSRADRSGGRKLLAENSPGPPPPATGSSVAANPFRDALFRLVRLGSNDSNGDDDSGDADALRARVVRACVRAMHSDDTADALGRRSRRIRRRVLRVRAAVRQRGFLPRGRRRRRRGSRVGERAAETRGVRRGRRGRGFESGVGRRLFRRRSERGDGDAGDAVAGPRGEPRGALARWKPCTRVERFAKRFAKRFAVRRDGLVQLFRRGGESVVGFKDDRSAAGAADARFGVGAGAVSGGEGGVVGGGFGGGRNRTRDVVVCARVRVGGAGQLGSVL